jgi:Flp pilus assembly protein TadB
VVNVPRDDDPILVTTAGQSPVAERKARERRYLITMGVRVVAFVAAIFLAPRWWWASAIAIALALLLPWFAVVSANQPVRPRRDEHGPTLFAGEQRPELTER